MGTDARTMAWIIGKPPVIGGSYGREEAPGRSVAIVARKAPEYYDRPLPETTVQGFGSVGANAARLLDEWGATVVALGRLSKAHEARGLRP